MWHRHNNRTLRDILEQAAQMNVILYALFRSHVAASCSTMGEYSQLPVVKLALRCVCTTWRSYTTERGRRSCQARGTSGTRSTISPLPPYSRCDQYAQLAGVLGRRAAAADNVSSSSSSSALSWGRSSLPWITVSLVVTSRTSESLLYQALFTTMISIHRGFIDLSAHSLIDDIPWFHLLLQPLLLLRLILNNSVPIYLWIFVSEIFNLTSINGLADFDEIWRKDHPMP